MTINRVGAVVLSPVVFSPPDTAAKEKNLTGRSKTPVSLTLTVHTTSCALQDPPRAQNLCGNGRGLRYQGKQQPQRQGHLVGSHRSRGHPRGYGSRHGPARHERCCPETGVIGNAEPTRRGEGAATARKGGWLRSFRLANAEVAGTNDDRKGCARAHPIVCRLPCEADTRYLASSLNCHL